MWCKYDVLPASVEIVPRLCTWLGQCRIRMGLAVFQHQTCSSNQQNGIGGLALDNKNSILCRGIWFSVCHFIYTHFSLHPASYPVSSRNSFPKDKVAREWNSPSHRISTFLVSIKNYFHHLKTLRMCSVWVCVGKWPLEQLVLSGPLLMNTTVIFSWISWKIQHWPSHQIPLDNLSILPKKATHSSRIEGEVEELTEQVVDATSSILWNIGRRFSPRTKSHFCWNGTLPGPSK